jgi:serine/threonine protein phosphatase 1
MKRTLVIGDIHGGLRALVQCLIRCKYDPKNDIIIFLGDYCDGWSETSELIEYLINLKKENEGIIFLQGNHDNWAAEWVRFGLTKPMWTGNGGFTTIKSYKKTGFVTKESHQDFFKNLLDYYLDDENRAFVHGGFTSRKGIGHEAHSSSYYWDRDLWELAVILDGKELETNDYFRPNPYRMFKHKEIYIGHTSTVWWKVKSELKEYKEAAQWATGPITVPMHRCNIWNLDTGGGWGGKLTVMDIDTKEYWQSDYVKNLYPDEKGRD